MKVEGDGFLKLVIIVSGRTSIDVMDVISGMATMAMAISTISFGHRSGYRLPKSVNPGHRSIFQGETPFHQTFDNPTI